PGSGHAESVSEHAAKESEQKTRRVRDPITIQAGYRRECALLRSFPRSPPLRGIETAPRTRGSPQRVGGETVDPAVAAKRSAAPTATAPASGSRGEAAESRRRDPLRRTGSDTRTSARARFARSGAIRRRESPRETSRAPNRRARRPNGR